MVERLKAKGDLLKPMLNHGIDLHHAIRGLDADSRKSPAGKPQERLHRRIAVDDRLSHRGQQDVFAPLKRRPGWARNTAAICEIANPQSGSAGTRRRHGGNNVRSTDKVRSSDKHDTLRLMALGPRRSHTG